MAQVVAEPGSIIIANPSDLNHDSVFKDLLGNREFRIAFMKKYLPKEIASTIDYNSVELLSMNVEHIRQQDKNNVKQREQSDIAFLFRYNGTDPGIVIFHIENQTEEDKTILLRTLHYQTSLLLDFMKSNKQRKLPVVFSIIYYANKKPFSFSDNIFDYFADPILARKYAFKPKFVDLSLIPDQVLINSSFLSGYELIFKHIRRKDLRDFLVPISIKLKCYNYYVRRILIRYMSKYLDMEPEKFYDIMIENHPNIEADVMTVAETLENRGVQQGMQQGVIQGSRQTAEDIALRMLNNGCSFELVSSCTGLSSDAIAMIKTTTKH